MKKIQGLLVLLLGITLSGCSGAFWGGTGAGALGAGAGYEIQAQRQMNKLDEELKSGKITQSEYDIRKDQIKQGSVLK
jgi:osmotically-inducible protein OsmY